MIIYTMGFAQKNAETFFELIKKNEIELLIDIRLNNKSQLAGFTKGPDLKYFLKRICNCEYDHCIEFAPTKEILDAYKKNQISWQQYVDQFIPLMERRNAVEIFNKKYKNFNSVCFLCSEPTPEKCHRRLLSDIICKHDTNINIKHI